MTREALKKHWLVVEAYKNGKTIQIKNHADNWVDLEDVSFFEDSELRVKPEPRQFYVAIYKDGLLSGHVAANTESAAKDRCPSAKEFIPVREVL